MFATSTSSILAPRLCHKVSLAGVKYKKLSILGHQAHVCNKRKLYFGKKTVPQSFLGRCVPAPPLDSPLTALLAGKVFCQGEALLFATVCTYIVSYSNFLQL